MGWIDRYTLVSFDREEHLPLLWEYYADPEQACLIGHVRVTSQEGFRNYLDDCPGPGQMSGFCTTKRAHPLDLDSSTT